MTLPDERTRAVFYAREFLRDLLNPRATPRVPRAIRRRAYTVLKHFPSPHDLERALTGDRDVFDVKTIYKEWKNDQGTESDS